MYEELAKACGLTDYERGRVDAFSEVAEALKTVLGEDDPDKLRRSVRAMADSAGICIAGMLSAAFARRDEPPAE